MVTLIKSGSLLLALLNPFLVIIYLIDLVNKLEAKVFRSVLIRAGLITSSVFCIFVVLGDSIFSTIINVEFASFQIFGGIIFLMIGLQFVFKGPTAIEMLRGESEHLSGAVAMPVLIGPGTISASVLIGKRHEALPSCVVVTATVFLSIIIMLLLKQLHDYIKPRQESLIERYIEIAGRITALYVGTVAIEMIMRGFAFWVNKFDSIS